MKKGNTYINEEFCEITEFDNQTSFSIQLPFDTDGVVSVLLFPEGDEMPSEYKIYHTDDPSNIIKEGILITHFDQDSVEGGYWWWVEAEETPDLDPVTEEYLLVMETLTPEG